MSQFGEMLFVEVAVQVIPVLVVVVIAEEFTRRDMDDPIHRIHASITVAIGLVFGIVGEVVGFQALLTGPTRETIPSVAAGLMALGATALLPRLAELHLPMYGDAARRFMNKMLPSLIAAVGFVFVSLDDPLAVRIAVYVFLGVGLVVNLVEATQKTRRDLKASKAAALKVKEAVRREQHAASNVPNSGAANEEPETQRPHHTPSDASSATATPRGPGWTLVVSMAGAAAVKLAIERRRRRS